MSEQKTNIKIGPVRFSYVHVFEPYAGPKGDQTPKYQVSIIVPRSNTKLIREIEAAIEAAKQVGKTSKWNGKIPPKLEISFQDGDNMRPDDEAYKDSYFISAKSSDKPGIVDRNLKPILDKSEFYSGCWGYADINFYPYDVNSKGIACGLNNLMKTKDDEPLGGNRESADKAFEGIKIEDDGGESFLD